MSGISLGGHREIPQQQKINKIKTQPIDDIKVKQPLEEPKIDTNQKKIEDVQPKNLVSVQEMHDDISDVFDSNNNDTTTAKITEKAKNVFDIPEHTVNNKDLNKLLDNGRVLNEILDGNENNDKVFLSEVNYTNKPEKAKVKDITRQDIGELVNNFNPSTLVKELDKTLSKDKVYSKAKELGKTITQDLPKDMQLGIKLSTDQDLKEIVAKSIAVKDKYHDSYDKALSKYTEGMGKLTPLLVNAMELKNDKTLTIKQRREKQTEIYEKAYDIAKEYSLLNSLPKNRGAQILLENIKQPPSLYSVLPENKKKLVNSMVSGMKESLPDKASSEKTKIQNIDMPNSITINNKTYSNPQYIAQGGMGAVFKYKNPNDENDTVIVKNLLESNKHDEMVTEIKNHTHAMGNTDNNPNIINLKGVVKGDGDELYMVMETAKTDNAKLKEKFENLVENNVISPEVKNNLVTLLTKDMLSSMEYLQKDKNMIHLDLKLGNYLVNSEGKSVLSDFGSSRRTQDGFNTNNFEATQVYASPEVISRLFNNIDDKKVINEKSDIWAFGMVLNDIVHGKSKLDTKEFNFEKQEDILNFGNDFNNRLIDDPKTPMDNVINSMCHPDPSQRPTFESVMKTSVFTSPNLEKPELREIIKEMISNNPNLEKIKKLSNDLS